LAGVKGAASRAGRPLRRVTVRVARRMQSCVRIFSASVAPLCSGLTLLCPFLGEYLTCSVKCLKIVWELRSAGLRFGPPGRFHAGDMAPLKAWWTLPASFGRAFAIHSTYSGMQSRPFAV